MGTHFSKSTGRSGKLRQPGDLGRASDAFIDETLSFWQPRMNRELTREQARRMAENAVGFFDLLAEWAADEARAKAKTEADIKGLPG